MIDDGVTNLSGKLISKLIHCFLDILTKHYNFDKHATISKHTVNARTWNLQMEI